MRPQSIRRFDLFYLASLALSAIGFLITYDTVVAQIDAQTAAQGVQVGGPVVIGSMLVGILISLVLWYLVSRKGMNIAKWILILLYVVGLRGIGALFSGPFGMLDAVNLAIIVLGAVAIFYLFQPDAKAWFSRSSVADEEDVQTSE